MGKGREEKLWGGPGLFFLEKGGGPKENFTMVGMGYCRVFCKVSHSLQFMWKIEINSDAMLDIKYNTTGCHM